MLIKSGRGYGKGCASALRLFWCSCVRSQKHFTQSRKRFHWRNCCSRKSHELPDGILNTVWRQTLPLRRTFVQPEIGITLLLLCCSESRGFCHCGASGSEGHNIITLVHITFCIVFAMEACEGPNIEDRSGRLVATTGHLLDIGENSRPTRLLTSCSAHRPYHVRQFSATVSPYVNSLCRAIPVLFPSVCRSYLPVSSLVSRFCLLR